MYIQKKEVVMMDTETYESMKNFISCVNNEINYVEDKELKKILLDTKQTLIELFKFTRKVEKEEPINLPSIERGKEKGE